MIRADRKAGTHGSGGTFADGLRGALRLAQLEVRRTRRSHLVAVAVALLMGIAASALFTVASGAGLTGAGSLAVILLNFIFLMWIGVLPRTGAWSSGDSSGRMRGLSSEGHLGFLRSLPLTVARVVAGRALVTLFSVLVSSAIFLAPLYLLSEPLRDQLGAGGCLLFAAFWIGCSLLFEAIGLFSELGLGGWAGFLVYIVLLGGLGGAVGSIGERVNVVAEVVELTRERALPALLALLLGGGLFALSRWATECRVRRREQSA